MKSKPHLGTVKLLQEGLWQSDTICKVVTKVTTWYRETNWAGKTVNSFLMYAVASLLTSCE